MISFISVNKYFIRKSLISYAYICIKKYTHLMNVYIHITCLYLNTSKCRKYLLYLISPHQKEFVEIDCSKFITTFLITNIFIFVFSYKCQLFPSTKCDNFIFFRKANYYRLTIYICLQRDSDPQTQRGRNIITSLHTVKLETFWLLISFFIFSWYV